MPRRRTKRIAGGRATVSGMIRRPVASIQVIHGAVHNRFVDLPAEPAREIRWDLPPNWDGDLQLDREVVTGSRVKPVVVLPEELCGQVDRHALRQRILDAGATYCKVPTLQVKRRLVKRDERHRRDLSLEESLRLFAGESTPQDAEGKIDFALELARAADAGEVE